MIQEASPPTNKTHCTLSTCFRENNKIGVSSLRTERSGDPQSHDSERCYAIAGQARNDVARQSCKLRFYLSRKPCQACNNVARQFEIHPGLLVFCLILLFFYLPPSLSAQTDADRPFSINEGTLIGIGGYHIKNTYLSPVNYTGTGLRIVNERMKMVSKSDQKISSYQVFDIDLSSVRNPAGSVSALAGFADYTFGYHYRFQPSEKFKFLTGSSLKGMFGFVYNTQSANNPIATHIDLDLNISVMGIYALRIKNYPLTFRFQSDIPLAGTLFTPAYGQSYFEIFGLGNTSGIVGFSSLHNKFTMRNYVSVDFSVWTFTLRMGYLNSYYMTDIKDIQTRYVSNNLMIGLVKEFISYSGKHLKKEHGYRSAYY